MQTSFWLFTIRLLQVALLTITAGTVVTTTAVSRHDARTKQRSAGHASIMHPHVSMMQAVCMVTTSEAHSLTPMQVQQFKGGNNQETGQRHTAGNLGKWCVAISQPHQAQLSTRGQQPTRNNKHDAWSTTHTMVAHPHPNFPSPPTILYLMLYN